MPKPPGSIRTPTDVPTRDPGRWSRVHGHRLRESFCKAGVRRFDSARSLPALPQFEGYAQHSCTFPLIDAHAKDADGVEASPMGWEH
jgi:hypothetical protein